MRLGDPVIQLSLKRFRLMRDMINAFCGIYFTDDNLYLMENRLVERLIYLGLDSFDDYYHYLKYSPKGETELEEVIELLTTNETYFFREEYQLRAFTADILPELHRRLSSRRRLMIWSAGCSTGEEAYTIAMMIMDSGLFTDWDVRIFGCDISRRVLSKARRGIYSSSAFRSTRAEILTRRFTRVPEGWRVNDDIRAMCHFGHLNLLDEERIVLVGRVDAIFCRNVLIYFDKRSKSRLISLLYDRLREGGYLLLGHTESLLNVSTAFELVHLSEDLVYRRPEVGYGE